MDRHLKQRRRRAQRARRARRINAEFTTCLAIQQPDLSSCTPSIISAMAQVQAEHVEEYVEEDVGMAGPQPLEALMVSQGRSWGHVCAAGRADGLPVLT